MINLKCTELTLHVTYCGFVILLLFVNSLLQFGDCPRSACKLFHLETTAEGNLLELCGLSLLQGEWLVCFCTCRHT